MADPAHIYTQINTQLCMCMHAHVHMCKRKIMKEDPKEKLFLYSNYIYIYNMHIDIYPANLSHFEPLLEYYNTFVLENSF